MQHVFYDYRCLGGFFQGILCLHCAVSLFLIKYSYLPGPLGPIQKEEGWLGKLCMCWEWYWAIPVARYRQGTVAVQTEGDGICFLMKRYRSITRRIFIYISILFPIRIKSAIWPSGNLRKKSTYQLPRSCAFVIKTIVTGIWNWKMPWKGSWTGNIHVRLQKICRSCLLFSQERLPVHLKKNCCLQWKRCGKPTWQSLSVWVRPGRWLTTGQDIFPTGATLPWEWKMHCILWILSGGKIRLWLPVRRAAKQKSWLRRWTSFNRKIAVC